MAEWKDTLDKMGWDRIISDSDTRVIRLDQIFKRSHMKIIQKGIQHEKMHEEEYTVEKSNSYILEINVDNSSRKKIGQ